MKLSLVILFLVSLSASIGAFAELSLEAKVTSFLTETERPGLDDWYYSLISTYKKNSELLGYRSYYHVGAELTLNDLESSQVFLPEAYVTNDKSDKWWFGRKAIESFKFEKVWSLSFVNPYYRKDYLAPVRQGLFGFHYKHNINKSFYLGASLLPIYLPDQGPKVNEDNGDLYSSNRWFGGQISEIQVGGGVVSEIKYDLETPKIDELLLNPGAIFYAGFRPSTQWSLKSLLAYKPMNQLHLAADIILDSSVSGSFDVLSEVSISVPYHKLAVLELSYTKPKFNLWADFIIERPERPKLEAKLFEANLEDRDQLSLGVDVLLGEATTVGISYLNAKLGKLEDEPTLVSGAVLDVEVNVNRHYYTEAMQLSLEHKFSDSFKVNAGYLYSFLEKGGLGSLNISKDINSKLQASIKLVVVGVDRESDEAFFTPVRDNDLFEIGVRYAL